MNLSVLSPKRPTGPGWFRPADWQMPAELVRLGYPTEAWLHTSSGLFVMSAVEVARDSNHPEVGPEYHLSVSLSGSRCTSADALWTIAQFDLIDAIEDNHVPSGRVRNFWRPVADRLSGIECGCIDDEPAIREDKGDFVWRGVAQ